MVQRRGGAENDGLGTMYVPLEPINIQVQFDNGEVKECASSNLKVQRRNVSVPPDVPSPSVRDAVLAKHHILDGVNVENQDKDEHLPQMDPEADEEEALKRIRKTTPLTLLPYNKKMLPIQIPLKKIIM